MLTVCVCVCAIHWCLDCEYCTPFMSPNWFRYDHVIVPMLECYAISQLTHYSTTRVLRLQLKLILDSTESPPGLQFPVCSHSRGTLSRAVSGCVSPASYESSWGLIYKGVYEVIIEILWKFVLLQKLVIRSGHTFPYVTAAELSWCVQSCNLIWSWETKLQRKSCSQKCN